MKKVIRRGVEAAMINREAHIQSRSTAKRIVNKYDEEQIDLVNECLDDVNDAISMYYVNGPDDDRSIGRSIFNIKKDYLMEAIEYEILTKEEFDELYEALETVRSEQAVAVS